MKKQNSTRNISKRLSVWAVIVASILTIPLLAKWPWTLSDFVFGAVGLFSFATIYELATKNMSNPKHRLTVGIAVILMIALVIAWAATGPD